MSTRREFLRDRNETRDSIDEKFLTWLWEAGFLPITVPNGLSKEIEVFLSALPFAGFVLSGGNDLGEFPERDETETHILNFASSNMLPVLGICRGMQMMLSYYDVKLVEVKNHVKTQHKISSQDLNLNGKIVNSYHRFGVKDPGEKFFTLAVADDEVVEAIKHRAMPWEGWMWHPEREETFKAYDVMRLKDIFNNKDDF